MKAILVSILLVSTLVAGPVGATAVSPSHSGGTDLAQYASGGYYDAEDLAAIYNENLDAVPGFFRGLLPAGADAEVIVYVFENDSMTVDYYFFLRGDTENGVAAYVLETRADGTIQSVRPVEPFSALDDERDRLIVSTTKSALDAIIVANDPGTEARQRYAAGDIRFNSEGNFLRGLVLWIEGAFFNLSRLFDDGVRY